MRVDKKIRQSGGIVRLSFPGLPIPATSVSVTCSSCARSAPVVNGWLLERAARGWLHVALVHRFHQLGDAAINDLLRGLQGLAGTETGFRGGDVSGLALVWRNAGNIS